MFLQIHYMTSYHASLLNRDDSGLAKRITFGGVPRLRISSQSQKRHWREWIKARILQPDSSLNALNDWYGYRTRHFFNTILKENLITNHIDETLADTLITLLADKLLTTSKNKKTNGQTVHALKSALDTDQPLLFGKPEADYLTEILLESAQQQDPQSALNTRMAAEKKAKNFKAVLQRNQSPYPAAGLEGALFGRFVTSDILARIDAPVHVAHAFTTHALDSESDFFTVVDDLARDEDTGAAHMNDMELGAGIFYGYVAIDWPLLLANLTGCDPRDWRTLTPQNCESARILIDLLIHAIAEVSPGAKLGATAPHARAHCVILEVGPSQPRSLANAFLTPVALRHNTTDNPLDQSVAALASYLARLDEMYGTNPNDRRYVSCLSSWPNATLSTLPLQTAIDHSLTRLMGDAS